MLVSGEAGMGKTSLVRAFASEASGAARVLVGACDDLVTPRTLGPFRDMARDAGGPLAEAVDPVAGRDAVVGAVHQELAGRPTVMIVEDAHWADDATLRVLRYLAWRIPALPSVLVLTYATTSWATTTRSAGSWARWPAPTCDGWCCGLCRPARSRSCRAASPTPARSWRPRPATPSS